MVSVLGIDEAGRGPVIGPLIIAGVMIKEGEEKNLGEVKDSKLLTHKKRIEFSENIIKNSKYFLIQVEPEEIDKAVESETGMNLNWLEAHKQAEIINKLNPQKAIIDCPSINCKAYEAYLRKLLNNKEIILVVEHKADFKYPVCSAASILAKVRREEEIEKLKQKYGDFGPGYPSNEITQNFVKENWDKFPEIFRHSWSTYKNFADKINPKKQKSLKDF